MKRIRNKSSVKLWRGNLQCIYKYLKQDAILTYLPSRSSMRYGSSRNPGMYLRREVLIIDFTSSQDSANFDRWNLKVLKDDILVTFKFYENDLWNWSVKYIIGLKVCVLAKAIDQVILCLLILYHNFRYILLTVFFYILNRAMIFKQLE